MRPGYIGTITNLQTVLNTQKNLYLNQATQKNTCQNFFNPSKKSLDQNLTPQNSHAEFQSHKNLITDSCDRDT